MYSYLFNVLTQYVFAYYLFTFEQYVIHNIQHTSEYFVSHRLQHHRTYSINNITIYLFKYLKTKHRLHHLYPNKNHFLINPTFDIIFGTYK